MSKQIYEWRVTNTTTTRVSFDDKALDPQQTVVISQLTDDVLNGYNQGRLLIKPDPREAGYTLASCVRIDPRTLPVPVRVIGYGPSNQGSYVVDTPSVLVPPMERRLLVPADRRRCLLRARNTGDTAVWLGGANIDSNNGLVRIEPGEIHTEDAAPGAAWYAYSDANLATSGVVILLQQVFLGVV